MFHKGVRKKNYKSVSDNGIIEWNKIIKQMFGIYS